ncbi:MAG: dihydrodipicolinate synthase family protein [Candidatus Hydrogenedentes bacterium]|nr:dihydrodipicolinate synthase family protein [Candidatus Hydrogenedentota bacterium]
MVPKYVYGAISNVFTVWDSDGSLDADGQRAFLDFLLSSRAISAYFVRSGMGQMYAYEYDDVKMMIDVACKHLAGKAPVLVGTAGIWDKNYDKRPDPEVFTRQAVELSKYAESAGAAGVVHTMPEAIAPKAGETCADVTRRYFETINAAVSIPIFIYQPGFTHKDYWVNMQLACDLASLPNVKGMKLSSDDARYIYDIYYAVKDQDFGMIAGSEFSFVAALYAGARACIGQGCTVNPIVVKAAHDRFEAGDRQGALDAQRSLNYLCDMSKATVEWLKRYAAEQGYPVKPYHRMVKDNPYMSNPDPLAEADYHAFKAVRDEELAKYENVPLLTS